MKFKIYEFSRGIKVAGTSDNWYSQGFTGELMNSTFDPVPQAIKDAIGNRLFAVAERGATEIPALVGREVEDENGQWSVMAVVTRGWDDGGRPFSAYRYFWCEGHDNLFDIAYWWWTINSKKKEELVFNPFNVPDAEIVVEDEQRYKNKGNDITTENFSDITDEKVTVPVVVGFNRPVTPVILDRIASKKVGNNLLAWAYNVEALELPRSFQVIFPSSQQAEETIRRVIANQSKINNSVQDEPAIKKAISLLSQNKVKPEYLKTIEDALSNPAIDDKYWKSMFDSQGAGDALKQGNYGHSMIRLLTLQAMVLPQTLPDFLKWLEKRNNQKELSDICAEFQSKILENSLKPYPTFCQNIGEGVKIIIPKLKNDEKLLEPTAWLLKLKKGVWHRLYKSAFRKEFESVITGKRTWNKEWTEISKSITYTKEIFRGDDNYLNIAKLFVKIKDPGLAAIFYYMAGKQITKSLFNNLSNYQIDNYTINIYGFSIKREITATEQLSIILVKIGRFFMPVYLFTPLLIIAILGSAFATYFGADRWFKTKAYNSSLEILTSQVMEQQVIKKLTGIDETKKREQVNQALAVVLREDLKENLNSTLTPIEMLSCQVAKKIQPDNNCVVIPKDTKTTQANQNPLPAIQPSEDDIDKGNKAALEKIISDLEPQLSSEWQNSDRETIKNTILKIIKEKEPDIPSFDYIYSISQGQQAIKSYQNSKGLDIDGVMSPGGKTATKLKCDVVKKLGNKYFLDGVKGCS